MSELVYEQRNPRKEVSDMYSPINAHNSNTQAIELYFPNSLFFAQKEFEHGWKDRSIEKQKEEIESNNAEPAQRPVLNNVQDSSIVIDAINICNEFDDDWHNIINAIPNPLEVEDYIELVNKQKNYKIYNKAWDLYDIITQIIDVGYQKESRFGNYKDVYSSIEELEELESKSPDRLIKPRANKLTRQLQRTLKRCLPSEEDLIKQTRRSPHISGNKHLNQS